MHLEDEPYIGSTRLQDWLLSVRSDVGETGTAVVDQTLELTRHRQMFSAEELRLVFDAIEESAASLN